MEYSLPFKQRLKTFLVSATCLAGAAVGAYYLYLDLNDSGGAGRGKPLAVIERNEAKVRRKPATSLVWSKVRTQESLYRRDTVQTSENSAATIRFEDGALLEIGANSMIVIDDVNNLALNFLKGSIVVRKASGDTQQISIGKDGKAKVEQLSIRLGLPEALERFFAPEKATRPIHFTWQAKAPTSASVNAAEPYVLQVASERTFPTSRTRVFKAPLGAGLNMSTDFDLPPGHYFWRVVKETAKAAASPSELKEFTIVPVMSLKPVWPAADQQVLSWDQNTAVQMRFLTPQESTETISEGDHQVELARDPLFRQTVSAQVVEPLVGSTEIKGLTEGTYFWRIRSKYGKIETYSAVLKFSIQKSKKVVLQLGKPDGSGSVEMRPRLRFNWNCDAEQLEFLWELAPAGQEKPIAQFKGNALSALWDKPAPGNYQWRVSAFHGGQPVAKTDWRPVLISKDSPIVLQGPLKNQHVYYWDSPPSFNFTWNDSSKLAASSAYVVEVSRDAEFKSGVIVRKSVSHELGSSSLGLLGGDYFWRVKMVDTSGLLEKISEVSKFTYGTYPPLRAPASVKPDPGTVMNVIAADANPVVSWAPVEMAENYEISIYSANPLNLKAPGKLLIQRTLKETHLSLKDLMKELKVGKYFWTVRSIDRLQRKGEALPLKDFTLTYGDTLAAPEAVSPEVQ